jgi:hypothetical protein
MDIKDPYGGGPESRPTSHLRQGDRRAAQVPSMEGGWLFEERVLEAVFIPTKWSGSDHLRPILVVNDEP